MDEKPAQTNTTMPPGVPAPPPNYIGRSNIVDRSELQSIYPVAPSPPGAGDIIKEGHRDPDGYDVQASALAEAKVLVCGVASATSYVLIVYLVKNLWITAIVSALLALAAIFFAISASNKGSRTGPLAIIGISAATITLVYIANLIVAQAILHSYASGYRF